MIDIHFQQVANRQRHSARNNVLQSSVPSPSDAGTNSTANNLPLTIDSHSDSFTDSEDSLDRVINRNVIRFGTQPNMNEGSSSSSSSNHNSNEQSSSSNVIPPTTVNISITSGDGGNVNNYAISATDQSTNESVDNTVNTQNDDNTDVVDREPNNVDETSIVDQNVDDDVIQEDNKKIINMAWRNWRTSVLELSQMLTMSVTMYP